MWGRARSRETAPSRNETEWNGIEPSREIVPEIGRWFKSAWWNDDAKVRCMCRGSAGLPGATTSRMWKGGDARGTTIWGTRPQELRRLRRQDRLFSPRTTELVGS